MSELLIRLVPFSAKDSYAHILEGPKVSPSSLDFELLIFFFFEFGKNMIKIYFVKLFWQSDIGQMGKKETWRPIKRWM